MFELIKSFYFTIQKVEQKFVQGEARYRRPNIAEFAEIAEKTYAISIFLAKILLVPISSKSLKFFEINVTNYFVGVMNDAILIIEFPKFTPFQLVW